MSDLEHLIENAVIAVEEGTVFADFKSDEVTKTLLTATDMFIDDIWAIAQYTVTTLKQDWKAKWEEENSPPTAEWIEDDYGFFSCSNCSYEPGDPEEKFPFCPICGREMKNGKREDNASALGCTTSICNPNEHKAASHDHHEISATPPIKSPQEVNTGAYNANTEQIYVAGNLDWGVSNSIHRGKRDDNGEFVYGSLIAYPDGDMYIAAPTVVPWCLNKYKVIPETVGGWTGLRDVNKKPIFEGDVIRHYNRLVGDIEYDHYEIGWIVWNPAEARYEQHRKDGIAYYLGACCRYEVTGNIHTNPV